MFKKLFGRKRSFRKMLTPVAAIVMLAQPAGNVIKAIPEGIDIQQNDAIDAGGVYLMTLSKYCEKTGGVNLNLNTLEKKLNYVKTRIDKDEDFKFDVVALDFEGNIGKKILLAVPNNEEDNEEDNEVGNKVGNAVFAKTREEKSVAICIGNDEIQALENHITNSAKQTLRNEGFPVNGENVNNVPNPVPNVGNELNPPMNLAQNVDDGQQALLNNGANAQGQIPGQNQDPNMINQNLKNVVNALQEQGQNNNNNDNPVNNQHQQNQGQNNNNGVGIGTFMLGVATGVLCKVACDVVGSQNNAGEYSEYSEGETETGYESDETDADSYSYEE